EVELDTTADVRPAILLLADAGGGQAVDHHGGDVVEPEVPQQKPPAEMVEQAREIPLPPTRGDPQSARSPAPAGQSRRGDAIHDAESPAYVGATAVVPKPLRANFIEERRGVEETLRHGGDGEPRRVDGTQPKGIMERQVAVDRIPGGTQ